MNGWSWLIPALFVLSSGCSAVEKEKPKADSGSRAYYLVPAPSHLRLAAVSAVKKHSIERKGDSLKVNFTAPADLAGAEEFKVTLTGKVEPSGFAILKGPGSLAHCLLGKVYLNCVIDYDKYLGDKNKVSEFLMSQFKEPMRSRKIAVLERFVADPEGILVIPLK